jgi:manganese-dependent inorganic pyrophosphatase
MPMFHAKSDLWDMSIKNLIQYDYKSFEFWNAKIWVWTLETTNPTYALERKNGILIWLEELKKEQNLDFIMLSIVDIIWEVNTTIILDWTDTEVLEKVFSCKAHNNLVNLWARLSRKKQIIPQLTEYFTL